MRKEIIYTNEAPEPLGPYSQAIISEGKYIFISGQVALDENGNLKSETISGQTEGSIKQIEAILSTQNLDLNNVVKTTVLMKDLTDFAEMNQIYDKFFGNSKPARATYQVVRLPKDALIEIEAIAVF